MTDDELTAINILEDMVNFLKELEDELRVIRQGNERELRNIKLRKAMPHEAMEVEA